MCHKTVWHVCRNVIQRGRWLKDHHFNTCGSIMAPFLKPAQAIFANNAIIAENYISCLHIWMQNKMRLLYIIMGNAHENLQENVIFNYPVLLTKLLTFNVSFMKMLGRSCITKTRYCCLKFAHPKILIPTQIQKYK